MWEMRLSDGVPWHEFREFMCPPNMFTEVHATSGGRTVFCWRCILTLINRYLCCHVMFLRVFCCRVPRSSTYSGHYSHLIWCFRSTETSYWGSYLFTFHSLHLYLGFSVSVTVGLSHPCLPFRKGRAVVPIFVFLSVSSSDVFDNCYKRKPLCLSDFLYMFLISFHPSIFHSSNECMHFWYTEDFRH